MKNKENCEEVIEGQHDESSIMIMNGKSLRGETTPLIGAHLIQNKDLYPHGIASMFTTPNKVEEPQVKISAQSASASRLGTTP